MAHDEHIAKAITELKTQDRPNIAAVAKKYKIARTTLSDRF